MPTPLTASTASFKVWPALPFEAWRPTHHNLHMWTQIVGKVRLALTPKTNHWWNVPLYVTARGLTTSPIPYGKDAFEIQFDFIDHQLLIDRCDGLQKSLPLAPKTVAKFYQQFMSTLHGMGIDVEIYAKPVEVPNPIRFAEDQLYKDLMTPTPPFAADAFFSPATRYSRSFAPAFSARAVRYTFSGEVSTLPSHVFPDGVLPSVPAPIPLRVRPTPTR